MHEYDVNETFYIKNEIHDPWVRSSGYNEGTIYIDI